MVHNRDQLDGAVAKNGHEDSTCLLRRFFLKYEKRDKCRRGNNDLEDTLLSIERFLLAVIDSDDLGFRSHHSRRGANEYRWLRLATCFFKHLNGFLCRYERRVFYSPTVALFFESCRDLGLLGFRFVIPEALDPQGVTHAERFNQLIATIRTRGRTREFQKKLSRRAGRRYAAFLNLVEYVNGLFARRSRLIVIRLELKYRAEYAKTIPVGQAQEDLRHFFANRRSNPKLFGDLLGYVWKMERGDHGGEHFHLFLFFSNDHRQDDCRWAQEIGEYWVEVITQGRGAYFNCNSPKQKNKFDRYGRLAIGRVEHHDAQARFNLLFALAYICKEEQSLREKPKKTSRTFGRGEMGEARTSNVGRPRAQQIEENEYLQRIQPWLAEKVRGAGTGFRGFQDAAGIFGNASTNV